MAAGQATDLARRPDPQAGGPGPGQLDGRAYRDGAGEPVLGRAEAELRAGKVTALRLGDGTG